jgi:hypothetical protein
MCTLSDILAQMSNKVVLGILGIVGILFLISLLMRGTPVPPEDMVRGTTPDNPISLGDAPPPPAGPIELSGEMGCLPHKGNPEMRLWISRY